ncbi:probable cytidine deaminase [Clytia hemisphaerica]|uniref:probable cytidine deaminase n=1 Tax=Clytia hemisphaerica TaxID=252671 RepID=UPI0034D7419B
MTLGETDKNALIEASISAKDFAYAKYSNFRVGCALLSQCGKTITGCNVENVSFGLTICAERTAYCKAISEGITKFKAIAIATDVKNGSMVSPCGACRQFMAEFGNIDIILVNLDRDTKETTLSHLLPMSFDEDALHNGQENGIKN